MEQVRYSSKAYKLLHLGAVALAQVEAAGMRVDIEYLHKTKRRITRMVRHLRNELSGTDTYRVWRRVYGSKANLNSNEQLGRVLFDEMGLKSPGQTSSGRHRTDESALETLDVPFVRDWVRMKSLYKALTTNIDGLLREQVDGYIHPFFNLHTTATYRSSSEAPNFQNQPVRDPEIKKLIRSAFIARPGCQIVEMDYKALEVAIAACYHQDPAMMGYLNDKTKDLHRDMACECYLLKPDQVVREVRFWGKSGFVFPQFYGDWYIDCAPAMWNAIKRANLATADGVGLIKHLASKGIHELGECDPKSEPVKGTFEHHIRQVERRFWEKRFPVYSQWKKDWYDRYRERGWFRTLTGFVCQGYMKKNEVINYPVQGSAFHCLLWALIRIVMKELRRRRMSGLVVGQIHDSLVSDVPVPEVPDYVRMCRQVMVDELKKAWRWVIVPLEVEAEVSPEGATWADKQPYEIQE